MHCFIHNESLDSHAAHELLVIFGVTIRISFSKVSKQIHFLDAKHLSYKKENQLPKIPYSSFHISY